MKKLDENLSEIFDIEPITKKEKTEIVPVVDELEDTNSEMETDFEFARNNIKDLLKKGDSAIENLLKVADESEHPRAYEVATGLIKTMADLNKDLLEIRKKKKELDGKSAVENNNTRIDKAVFVGSASEIVKLIKGKNDPNNE